jgi:hypothetical protein
VATTRATRGSGGLRSSSRFPVLNGLTSHSLLKLVLNGLLAVRRHLKLVQAVPLPACSPSRIARIEKHIPHIARKCLGKAPSRTTDCRTSASLYSFLDSAAFLDAVTASAARTFCS